MPLYYLTEEEAEFTRFAVDSVLRPAATPHKDERQRIIDLIGAVENKLDHPESFVADVTVSAQQLQTATLKLREMNGPMSPGNLEGAAGGVVRLHHNGGIFAIDKLGTGRAVEEEEL